MSLTEFIYNNSPVFIQNLLITAYGYNLKRIRYSEGFKLCLHKLEQTQNYSAEELSQYQRQQFKDMIAESLDDTPYYSKILRNSDVKAEDIDIENYSAIFPILTKEVLRQHQVDFVNKRSDASKNITISTSGTSGMPLTITTTTDALQKNYAFFYRYLSWAGVKYGDRCATFAGRNIIPPSQKNSPYWRYNHASNTMLCSSYHLSDSTIPAYIGALKKFKPVYIDSYPSAIFEIANYINIEGINHDINLKCVITSSETLFDYQREAIEKAFNCKVFDHLGSAEMVTLITQCEKGEYHFNPEFGLFEILDDDDKPVQPGTAGRLICTGLINRAMPLIRYDLGDTISLSNSRCSCGRNFPVVESIIGRTDDLILGCDGQRVGRLDPIFKKLSSDIKETQIIQTDHTNITVKMATDANYNKKHTDAIIDELRNRVGNCISYHVEYVDSIPKTKAGKFKTVISHIKNTNRP